MMRRAQTWIPCGVLAALAASVVLTPSGRAGEVGYVEDFALAKDRTTALRQLIPGTEDYYYYHALHLLNTGQFDKAEALTGPWLERHRPDRPADRDPDPPRPAHLREEPEGVARLPPQPARAALQPPEGDRRRGPEPADRPRPEADRPRHAAGRLVRAGGRNLDNFEDAALDWLAADELDLAAPPAPAPAAHPARRAEPAASSSPTTSRPRTRPAFGAFPVHAQLTAAATRRAAQAPARAADQRPRSSDAWVAKLQPGADADWQRDRTRRPRLPRPARGVRRCACRRSTTRSRRTSSSTGSRSTAPTACTTRTASSRTCKLPRHQPYMAQALAASAQRVAALSRPI